MSEIDETAKAILKWQGGETSCEYETGAMLSSSDLQAMARLWLLKSETERVLEWAHEFLAKQDYTDSDLNGLLAKLREIDV